MCLLCSLSARVCIVVNSAVGADMWQLNNAKSVEQLPGARTVLERLCIVFGFLWRVDATFVNK